jgi:hypothetical protein
MLLHRLPFSDDIRNYDFPSFNLESINNTQQDNIRLFVDNKTILNPMDSIIHPYNYVKNLIYNEIQKKLLMLNNSEISICDIKDPLDIESPGLFIFLCIYICIYINIYMHVLIYTYIYICMCSYLYICIDMHICILYCVKSQYLYIFLHLYRCQSSVYFNKIESLFSVESFCR